MCLPLALRLSITLPLVECTKYRRSTGLCVSAEQVETSKSLVHLASPVAWSAEPVLATTFLVAGNCCRTAEAM